MASWLVRQREQTDGHIQRTLGDSKGHIYMEFKGGNDNPVFETAKETQMYRTVSWTLWERERVRGFGRMALKHV